MKYAAQRSDEPDVGALLNEFLGNVLTFIGNTSRGQKRRLLIALEQFLPDDASMLDFWLKDLVHSKHISKCIDEACEHDQRRLLMLLEDFRTSDRRRHHRKTCSIEVTADDFYKEVVRNISAGGVFIQTSARFSVGRQVSLIFPFPTPEKPIRMTGEIVWKSPVGVGVRFKTASRRLKKAIESL